MNHQRTKNRISWLTGLLALFAVPVLQAQTTATAASSATVTPKTDEVVELSPFVVSADDDKGYRASSTLAGTRLRTDLRDVAASIQVITKDFMDDIGANNLEDLLTYTAGTEVEGLAGNISGSSASNTFTDFSGGNRRVQSQNRVRGIGQADQTRDYFISSAPMDGYAVDRVEINRGANAMLFGLGSPAGIINSGLLKAQPNKTKTKISTQFDQEGSQRLTLDHNHMLVKDKLAVRFATLLEEEKYQMKPAYIRHERYYLTGTWSPWKGATIRANYESGEQKSNKPYATTPVDGISWWWKIGKPVYNPITNVGTYLGTVPTDPNLLSFNSSGAPTGGLNNGMAASLHLISEDPNSTRLGVTGLNPAIQAIEGSNIRGRRNTAGTALDTATLRRTGTAQSYLQALNRTASPLLNDFWRDFRLTDESIYPFYDQMIEGPNKREWALWDTFNASIEQRLGQNAGVEVAYFKEKLNSGYIQPLQFRQNAIFLDISTHLLDGTPNPNLGRPLTNSEFGFQNNNYTYREAFRATAFYEMDFRDMKQTWLAKLLGRHVFTGAYTNQTRETYGYGQRLNTLDLTYPVKKLVNAPLDTRDTRPGSTQLSVRRQAYLGPSLLNAAGPQNAGIQGVTALQNIDHQSVLTAQYYERPPTNTSPLGVYKVDSFGIIQPEDKYNLSRTSSGGDKGREAVNSIVIVANNYWWDHTLVSTVGWRQDKQASFGHSGSGIDPVTGLSVYDPAIWTFVRQFDEKIDKINYGLVLHTPPFLRGKLPFGSSLSLTYNKSDNFQPARPRYDTFGNLYPSTSGNTEEWGVLLTMFDSKLELRAIKYKTNSVFATASLVEVHNSFVRRFRDQMNAIRTTGYRDAMNALGLGSQLAAWDQFEASATGQGLKTLYNVRTSSTDAALIQLDERIGEVTSVTDTTGEGMEFDMTYNPTRQWRISVNVAKQESLTTNTGKEFVAMRALIDPIWSSTGTAGLLRQSLTSNNTLGDSWGTTRNELDKQVLLDGGIRPEVRRWRYNIITNYSFNEGVLKGLRLGGAYRWQDKAAIGYPTRVVSGTAVTYDVTKPFFGPAEANVDLWVGYSRKVFKDRVRWNVQLNVKNVGKGNRLVAVSVQPDGTPDSPRIAVPQMVSLTNSFEF